MLVFYGEEMLAPYPYYLEGLTLKKEAVHSSETLVTTNKCTYHVGLVDHNQHLQCCENLKSQMFDFLFKETITDHRRTFSPDCTRDLIDSFLEEMELRNKQTDSTFHGKDNKL
jgi:hypothetical protein